MLRRILVLLSVLSLYFLFSCSKADAELKVSTTELDFKTDEIEQEFTIENSGSESDLFESGVEQLKYDIELPNGGDKSIKLIATQEATPAPSQPSPINNGTNQELALDLTWECPRAHSFDVLFGSQNPPQTKVVEKTKSKTHKLEGLDFGKTYYWQVIAHYAKVVSGDTVSMDWKQIPSAVWRFSTKGGKAQIISPSIGSTNQQLSLQLQWQATEAEKIDIYYGTDNPPTTLIGKDKTENSIDISGLSYNTKYYWKVDTYYSSPDVKIEGDIWNFTTKERFAGNPGFKLTKHQIETELPSFVNIMFQVTNLDGLEIEDLNTSDFDVLEDNLSVSPTESAMQIRKKVVIPYTLKTVLMLDNSNSVAANLQDIKNAAIALVENIEDQQEIAIYKFSENVELVQDYSSDVNALKDAINSIKLGYASTNLYGAIIEGVSRWNDSYSTSEIKQGFLVALTDGSDTQGSHTKQEALNTRGNKKVYTVGLGNEIDPDVLQDLGNAGFFSITNVSELATKFTEIQSEMALYTNSFYWLNYISPKRGDKNHTLKLYVKDNPHTGSDSYITGQFNSKDFYSVFQGLYVNVDDEQTEGIDGFTIADTVAYPLSAMTYLGNNPPEYEWSTSDSTIVRLEFDKDNSSKVIAYAAGTSGICDITVSDVANSLTKVISVDCVVEPSVRINSTEEKPEGIDELEILETDTISVTASTYLQTNPPQYSWLSANESVVLVVPNLSNSAIASIVAVGDSGLTTTITVEDVANNGLSKTIDVAITKSTIPTDGLVAYYPFNGNANDESGNGNNGIVNGATLENDRFGNNNCSYNFDGNDYIEISTESINNLNVPLTVSLWVKPAAGNDYFGYFNILAKESIYSNGFGIEIYGSKNKIQMWPLGEGGTSWVYGSYSNILDVWLHIVSIYSETGNSFYINGELKASNNVAATFNSSSYPLRMGYSGRPQSHDKYYKGIIDDVRIYNRDLTENEVLLLFQEGK